MPGYMRFPTHLVPRAAKNLLPGYRRHWRHSYAALLSEAEQVVSNLTFGCLTVSYSDDGIEDEAPAAKKIAEHLGMDHEIVVIDPKNEPVDPASVIEILGHPNESTTALSVLQMSQTASSRGYKVGLTGAGGDEMFLGYGKNAYFYKHYGLFGLPQGIRRLFAKLTRPFGGWDLRINRLARDAFVSDAEQYLANKIFQKLTGFGTCMGFLSGHRKPSVGRVTSLSLCQKLSLI
jgi:asparagine synthetase B (glutamine-hydrolysing)